MTVKCEILLCKPKDGLFQAGQSIRGFVKYHINKPTVYKDVTLTFLGKGKCHWTGEYNNDYTGKQIYIVDCINILNENESIILHGDHQYPFTFYLPEDIPRSYKDKRSSITYTIELKFVKPSFFSFNRVFTTEVLVQNYITPNTVGPVTFGLDKKITSLSAKTSDINLKVEINKTCLTPGENASLIFKLNNNSDVRIKSVKTELYCYVTYTSDCVRKMIVYGKVDACKVKTTSIEKRSTCGYACLLPTPPGLYSLDNSRIIKKEFRVRVTVQLPMPHKNAMVEMPVLIKGQERGFDYFFGEDPLPYWEAMCEKRKFKIQYA